MTRSSIAARNLSKKFISTFFAATLALGLVPAAAFAADGEEADNVISSEAIEANDSLVIPSGEAEGLGDEKSADAPSVIPSDSEESDEGLTDSFREGETVDTATGGDDATLAIPAATQRVSEDVTLTSRTVAQAESTRSYFLAQTLESTRTVPIVSANLPLDTGTVDAVEPDAEGESSASEEEGDAEGDDPDSEGDPAPVGPSFILRTDGSESETGSNEIAASSTVVGSFTYRGITYAVEPGGESVAVVAADYAKLPEEFVEAQTIVLPSMVTSDGLDYYSVTSIADRSFSTVKPSEDEEGITAITIPASVTFIGDDAFTNFDTLQYVIVSEDNPIYGMYDGCLYDADLTSLLLIPEGRLGAVWVAPSATTIDPEVFSHCALVDTVVADPDSAAYQLLEENDDAYLNAEGNEIRIASSQEESIENQIHETGKAYNDLISSLWGEAELDNVSGDSIHPVESSNLSRSGANASTPRIKMQSVKWKNGTRHQSKIVYTATKAGVDMAPNVGTSIGTEPGSVGTGWGTQYPFYLYYLTDQKAYVQSEQYANLPASLWITLDNYPVTADYNCRFIGTGVRNSIPATNSYRDAIRTGALWRALEVNGTVYSGGDAPSSIPTGATITYYDANAVYYSGNSSMGSVPDAAQYEIPTTATVITPPVPEPTDPSKYAFAGWKLTIKRGLTDTSIKDIELKCNPDGSFPAGANTLATLKKADGTSLFDTTDTTVTNYIGNFFKDASIYHYIYNFEAQFAEGYALNWDVSTFGGDNSVTYGTMGEGDGFPNRVTGDDGKNRTELVKLLTNTETSNLYGVIQFPEVTHAKEGSDMRFRGWTTNADGAGPYYAYDGGKKYKVYADKIVEKDNEDNVIYSGTTMSMQWYAVWDCDVVFNAESYGGKVAAVSDEGAQVTIVTVRNNQPIPTEKIPQIIPSVPDYDIHKWEFKGWTTTANPNFASIRINTQNADGLGCKNGSTAVLIPSGPTIYYGVWECDVSWATDTLITNGGTCPSGADINQKDSAWYLYGYQIAAPGVKETPASHHFSHWSDTAGNSIDNATGIYTVLTGGPVIAYWAPNERKVELNGNDAAGAQATPRVMYTYAVYGNVVEPYPVNAAENNWDKSGGQLMAPTRPGYEFAGYWNTQWDEGAGAKCYLKADPTDKRYLASTEQTWDITNSTQVLYAHWKYKIYLSTNSWNSSGEQLTDAGAGSIDTDSVPAGTLKTDAQGTYFETIDGAPITLPSVTGRTGYLDSGKGTNGTTDVNARAWGVKAGSFGWSTGIIPTDSNGATSGDPTKLTLDTSNITATRAYDNAKYFASQDASSIAFPVPTEASGKSITLYLNWENRAKVYDVTLTSVYDPFTVSNTPTPKVKAVYDAPILMERDGSTIVYVDFLQSSATNGIAVPEKIAGSGANRHHEYIFKGFRTEENELDGTNGTEYIGAKVTGTGADIAAVASAVTLPWRTDEANPVLFAAYGRVKSTLTLDLNGGSIAGLTGTVLTVMANGTEFTFEAGKTTPALPGTYATAPERQGYVFKGYYTAATGSGAAYAPYAEDGTNQAYYVVGTNADRGKAVSAGLEWDFYTNITLYAHWEYKLDFRLDHATDCASSNPDGQHTAMTLMNAPVTEGATDAYGNKYPVGGAEVTATESNLIVTALAGVPVMVPVAQNRNGYNDTYTWQVRQNDSVSGAARATVTGDKTNRYFTPGVPFAGITPNANTHVITAYVDWTDQEKTYWVEIVPDQIDTGTLGTKIAASSPRYMKVVFNDTFPVDANGNVLATAPRDTDDTRNLVFTGIYNAPAAIGDTSGTRYVRVVSDATTPDAAFVPKTRTDGYRIEDALVTTTNASSPTASSTHPIPVYARWAYPSCFVSFDMNTGNIAGADKVENAFELQTNDALPNFSTLSGDAAALTTKPIKRADGGASGTSDYVFDGYWSAPTGGKQYYTKDLAAAPGVIWDFAGATTLYAHWTYTVRLNLNAEVPASLQDTYVDGLSVTKANAVDAEPAPTPVAGDAPARIYAITVVWGADATVPATTANVKRVRYEKPYNEAAPETVQSDYAFAGWLAAASDEDTKFAPGTNVALGGENRNILVPSAGTMNLYAKWTCEPYRVVLDPKGGASLPNDAFAQAEDGTYVTGIPELTGVTFDEPVHELGDTLSAPHRLGYTFLGYYETPQASDPDHQSACYLESTDGGMAATTTLWPSHRGTGTTPTLYAHYTQNRYIISFDLARPNGETTNPVEQPARITPIDGVTYQTVLDTFSSTDLVITCEGYKFGGWYTEPDGKGRMMFSDTGAGQGTYALEDNVTLHPLWTPRTLSVVWDFNLPKAADMTMAAKRSTETYNQPRSATAPAVPTVTGYTFVGWFRDKTNPVREWPSGATFRPSATDLAASEITYYAHWSANSYTVTLLPGEHGTYANMTSLDVVHADGAGGYIYVHPYTVADGNWLLSKGEPEPQPGWDPFGWEQVVRNDDNTDWVVVKESVDYVNAASFTEAGELTFRAKWTATKATVRLNLGECDGVECDAGALGDFPLSFKYGIGMARALPDDLNWPGHTFLGWQLTKRDDTAIAKPAPAAKGVLVEAADNANPPDLEYTACWVTDQYTIEFVKSTKDDTAVAEAVITGTDASGNVVALGRDTVFTFPKPAFRGGFTGGTVAGDVLTDASSYIFSHYKTALGGAYLPGQTCTVADLLTAYPALTDTQGRTPQNGSTIRLYAEPLTPVYQVDVPLVVSITFDPDHVENSVKTADANLLIRRTNQTASLEVAGLICDPIAAAGASTPGTSGTFDDNAAALDGTYLTLIARKGTEASAGEPVEINLGQMSRNAGKGVTVSSVTAADGTVKSLRDAGFAFGGNSIAARTLNLTFGLRFDSSVDTSKLMFLNSKTFKDSGKTVPIARVYYTLALVQPQAS